MALMLLTVWHSYKMFKKLFKKKIIFIETFARVNSKSMSGKMINKIADVFLVQHEEMLDVYENAIYKGDLY